jgi:hypothetical protein
MGRLQAIAQIASASSARVFYAKRKRVYLESRIKRTGCAGDDDPDCGIFLQFEVRQTIAWISVTGSSLLR